MIVILAAWIVAAAAADPAQAAVAQPPASPTLAAPPSASAVQVSAPPKKSRGDEKVCWDETPTGTRFSRRVCATRAELEERRRHDQDWKMQSNSWGSYNPGY
jgi:hypothetical protein